MESYIHRAVSTAVNINQNRMILFLDTETVIYNTALLYKINERDRWCGAETVYQSVNQIFTKSINKLIKDFTAAHS